MNSQLIRSEIESKGWAYATQVRDQMTLLELANCLGKPVHNNKALSVQELHVRSSDDARQGTLSSIFGNGAFPLHTDTAYLPVPARFLVMRVEGDLRRPTVICTFKALYRCMPDLLALTVQSIWLISGRKSAFYCPMRITNTFGAEGFRYDRNCMVPANEAARKVHAHISSIETLIVTENIDWSLGYAVVIDNWRILHGRGASPKDEQSRTLQRIYVEQDR